jgi:hypothetical protein
MSPAALKEHKTGNLNVRIPTGQLNMLRQIADRLDVTVNLVVASILLWNLEASRDQELWMRAVRTLRDLIVEDDDRLQLYDFDDSEWDERLRNYRDMENIGLIDDLRYRRSSASTSRWLCSFRLTNTGRVIASVLQDRAEDDAE